MQAFINHPEVLSVSGQGDTKASVEFNHSLRAQLWVHPPERWGTALVYATGSKDHNVRLRELAIKQGLSLSDQAFARPDGSEILTLITCHPFYFVGPAPDRFIVRAVRVL